MAEEKNTLTVSNSDLQISVLKKNLISFKTETDIFKAQENGEALPTLANIRKAKGLDKTVAWIELWILDLLDFIGEENFSVAARNEVATMIITDNYYLTIADIYLFFKRLKQGYYGELYGKMTAGKFMSFWNKYIDDRFYLADEYSFNNHLQFKENRNDDRSCNKIDKFYKEFKKQKLNNLKK